MARRTCPHCGKTIPLETVANLPDLVVLLKLVRDALDRGHGDLARTVVHLLIEHQMELGLRSRNLARQLAEEIAEREQAPPRQ